MLVLTTSRLLLRPVWPEDAPAFARLITREVAEMTATIPWPYHPADAEAFCATRAWPEAPLGTARAVIVEKARGQVLGMIGFGRNLVSGESEFGCWLAQPAWGQGFATEAARAWVGLAFGLFGLDELHTGYFAEDPASARVLTKLGFKPTGVVQDYPCRARGGAVKARTLHLTRADWKASKP